MNRWASKEASLVATKPLIDETARRVVGSKFTPVISGCSWNMIKGRPTSAMAKWYAAGTSGLSGSLW